jgi:hypothetical protein
MPSPVTAVGRRLRPRNGEPRRHRVVAVRPDGSARIVLDRTLSHGQEETDQSPGQGPHRDG